MSDDTLSVIISTLVELQEGQRSVASQLEELTSDVNEGQERLEAGQRDMLAQLGTLEVGQAELRTETGRFREQLLNRLTAIGEDIGVNMARADRVAETNTDIRAELVGLRVENSALWRMIKALEARVNQIEAPPS